MGYNNLLYISLLLASMSFRASEKRRGQNAAVFPMLLIEEPEAHLHPALQYKLLAHIVSRVQKEPHQNRQVFVTTHSTHVTSAARPDPIICLSVRNSGEIGVAYPARLFPETKEGKESRAYVERYLDAAKSAMLFAKATLLCDQMKSASTTGFAAAAYRTPASSHSSKAELPRAPAELPPRAAAMPVPFSWRLTSAAWRAELPHPSG